MFPARAQVVNQILLTNVGPAATSESLIRANIRTKVGETYNRSTVDDDVRNLYATGFFLNIQVAEQRTDGGLTLLYVLQGRPKMTEITFSGNKKYSDNKLRKKISSKEGQPYDERKLFMDSQEIKKMYQNSGYPQTKVEYVRTIDEQAGKARVNFEITETPKVKIAEVNFDGAKAFTQRKLRKVIKTRKRWMFSWLTGSGVLKDEQLEEDKERLAEFYRSEGYIDFELQDVRYVYQTPRKVVLHFVVNEGRQYRVGAVNFKGITLFPSNEVYRVLKMKVGSVFTPQGMVGDMDAIQDLYGAKGYIDAAVQVRRDAEHPDRHDGPRF